MGRYFLVWVLGFSSLHATATELLKHACPTFLVAADSSLRDLKEPRTYRIIPIPGMPQPYRRGGQDAAYAQAEADFRFFKQSFESWLGEHGISDRVTVRWPDAKPQTLVPFHLVTTLDIAMRLKTCPMITDLREVPSPELFLFLADHPQYQPYTATLVQFRRWHREGEVWAAQFRNAQVEIHLKVVKHPFELPHVRFGTSESTTGVAPNTFLFGALTKAKEALGIGESAVATIGLTPAEFHVASTLPMLFRIERTQIDPAQAPDPRLVPLVMQFLEILVKPHDEVSTTPTPSLEVRQP